MFFRCLGDAAKKSRLKRMNDYTQHGDTSCLLHTIAVAYYSERLAGRFSKRRRELIRGALLHDYFLYDWHDGLPERRVHGFTHPNAALRNALDDFELTDVERDIIKKHMFPLTPVPPRYRESWAVCVVDKACSVYEVFAKKPYPKLKGLLKTNNNEIYNLIAPAG